MPVPTTLDVAILQTLAPIATPEANIDRLEAALERYRKARLFVCAELYLCGYSTADATAQAIDIEAGHPLIERLCRLAATYDTALVLGLAEQRGAGISNSVVAIDRSGELCGIYRKVQLFGDEDTVFEPGDALCVVDIDGMKIGLMICFDIEFPEIARALTHAGADVLLATAANMRPFGPDHRLFAQARALENRRPLLYCNQVGQGPVFEFVGGSAVMDAQGQVQTDAGVADGVIQACVSLRDADPERPDYIALCPAHWPEVEHLSRPDSV